jgi:hypothetical protein
MRKNPRVSVTNLISAETIVSYPRALIQQAGRVLVHDLLLTTTRLALTVLSNTFRFRSDGFLFCVSCRLMRWCGSGCWGLGVECGWGGRVKIGILWGEGVNLAVAMFLAVMYSSAYCNSFYYSRARAHARTHTHTLTHTHTHKHTLTHTHTYAHFATEHLTAEF